MTTHYVCNRHKVTCVDAQEGGVDGQLGKEGGAQHVDKLVTGEGKGQDANGGDIGCS